MNVELIITACRELATEQPGVIYDKGNAKLCRYTRGEAGCGSGCIIGQAILNVYPELEPKLLLIDAADEGTGVRGLLQSLGIKTSENQICWLSTLQGQQDFENPWGASLATADETVKL
jgi:hypothetical protein